VSEPAIKQHLWHLYDKFQIADDDAAALPRRVHLANAALESDAVKLGDLRAVDREQQSWRLSARLRSWHRFRSVLGCARVDGRTTHPTRTRVAQTSRRSSPCRTANLRCCCCCHCFHCCRRWPT